MIPARFRGREQPRLVQFGHRPDRHVKPFSSRTDTPRRDTEIRPRRTDGDTPDFDTVSRTGPRPTCLRKMNPIVYFTTQMPPRYTSVSPLVRK